MNASPKMYPADPAAPAALQRVRGRADVGFGAGGRLLRLVQAGSAKAFVLPAGAGDAETVFLNTAGGLTGGDRLDYGLSLPEGMRASATTQTAERAYRSAAGEARVSVRLSVADGARLDWLPQETILFDGARLHRQTEIALSGRGSCLALEAVVLGRAAMGERLTAFELRDDRRILRDGKPVALEPVRLTGDALDAPALLNGARALAGLTLVATGAEAALGAVRAALGEPGVTSGASAWDGRLSIRLLAADGWPLRRQILRLLAVLRPGPVPRVWQI